MTRMSGDGLISLYHLARMSVTLLGWVSATSYCIGGLHTLEAVVRVK